MSFEINFPVEYVNAVKLAAVKPGGCFTYEGKLWMRTAEIGEKKDLCVCLKDGFTELFDADTLVVSLYLKIEGM